MKPVYRKRRKSWNEPGHGHFLMWSCYKRIPLLTKDRTRRWVVEAMEAERKRQNIALWAYVIMPEHVHLFLFPRDDDYQINRILAALKRPVAQKAKKHLIQTGQTEWIEKLTVRYPSRTVFRFWQSGGGYDKNIAESRSIRSIVDYIHHNPVRRGLVNHPLEWKWSSARFWEGETEVAISMDEIE